MAKRDRLRMRYIKGTEFDSSEAHEGAVSCVWKGTGSANKSSWSANNHVVCASERDFV